MNRCLLFTKLDEVLKLTKGVTSHSSNNFAHTMSINVTDKVDRSIDVVKSSLFRWIILGKC